MGEDGVRLRVEGPVATIVIEREGKLNAFDAAMVAELQRLCALIERDAAIRVAVMTGAGAKAFSAGGDIEAWSRETPEDFGRFWVREGHAAFDALARLRQPLIAVLNGHALGGGLELAACADYRIAEAHAKIGQPETGLGIIPGWSGTQRATRRFGAQAVRRMAIFGEILTAGEARELGIVDEVVDTGQGFARATVLAEKVCSRAPLATEIAKMLVNAAETEETERVFDCLAGMAAAQSSELQAGLAAFRQRRPPKF
ncbi:enoyl-CoA hydratase/isomerase family protein [Labrys sp. LIt4]|uniref:Enoyl-CoA hydratase n=1 Tax=Labrys okinawensis TaxID=346911 RepID=A0A2S9QIY1_9HYPH|nr:MULTISPECIES: enoyl-CoA hydratase/isomerase family protein [Labrys]MBP0581210.1 enoyl-CoA hydratase/isomerase family protein [Labrys sp. LIt4]PRH89270.1 enoyl-CoA hydratase [Labrys okinawensis]